MVLAQDNDNNLILKLNKISFDVCVISLCIELLKYIFFERSNPITAKMFANKLGKARYDKLCVPYTSFQIWDNIRQKLIHVILCFYLHFSSS